MTSKDLHKKGWIVMRTRLRPRLCIGLPAEKSQNSPRQKTAKTKPLTILPCLACAGVLILTTSLVPRLPHLQEGVLLAAKLTLALPLTEQADGNIPSAPELPDKAASLPAAENPDEVSVPPQTDPSPAPESAVLPEETAPETDTPPSYAPIPIPDIVIDPPIAEENKAALVHKTYTAAPSNIFIQLEKGFIKNLTHHPTSDILTQIENPPYFTLSPGDEPQVLIMHTHTTESYFPFTGDHYDTTYPTRSTDNAVNMAAVGNVIADRLTAAGIGVLHDTTQHDHPSYNGSYDRSAVTVKNYLAKYPSIKIVLDVHRDAIISGDTVTAPVVEIDGQTAAQVMIISGCDNGSMNYPDYMKNLSFAAALQLQLESDHPGFTRPILFDYRKYNQHLTTGSLLLEVGSHGNTLEQALLAAEWIGDSLGILLNELRE